jgi:hypothetical protein
MAHRFYLLPLVCGAERIGSAPTTEGTLMPCARALPIAVSFQKGAPKQRPRTFARRTWCLVGLAAAVLALTGPSAALAANPDVNRFTDSGTDTDTDFCGTGKTVNIAFDVRGTEFLDPNGADLKVTVRGTVVFSNPLNGNTVIQRFAVQTLDTMVSGDPEGLHIVDFTSKGLPELFQTEHGGVLTRDAGYIVLRTTFDGDEFISFEIVLNRGPHPQAERDFELFCEIMTTALEL